LNYAKPVISREEYIRLAAACPRRGEEELPLGAKIGIGLSVAVATVALLLGFYVLFLLYRRRLARRRMRRSEGLKGEARVQRDLAKVCEIESTTAKYSTNNGNIIHLFGPEAITDAAREYAGDTTGQGIILARCVFLYRSDLRNVWNLRLLPLLHICAC
jgi:hypothetical protein